MAHKSALELFSRIDRRLTDYQRHFIRPMAVLSVRFSGERLEHVGRAASKALDLLLTRAPEATRWRGLVVKGAKVTRSNAPRPVTQAGLASVAQGLAALRKMPSGCAFQVYAKDGSTEDLAPERFAAWVSLVNAAEDSFATPRGFLAAGFPLDVLEARPQELVELTDQLVELLQAEVASLGPGVWLAPHCLFNSGSNELPDKAPWLTELFGVDPQLDAPHLLASRWPHTDDEVEPDLFSGLLAPSWTMWLDAKLARKVKAFPGAHVKTRSFTRYQLSDRPPFEMDEATYAAWRAGWQALSPVHLRCKDPSDTGKFFRERLSAPTHAQLLDGWRRENELAAAKAAKVSALLDRLRKSENSPEILTIAEEARGIVEPDSLCWHVLPSLVELVSAKKVAPEVGLVWLDYGQETGAWRSSRELTKDAAALAAVCGASDLAIALLREAFSDGRGKFLPLEPARKRELARDRRFASLRGQAAWKKLVG
ncbi:MAG: hypothetical protein QM765_32245 [Myxococcales bacterium]